MLALKKHITPEELHSVRQYTDGVFFARWNAALVQGGDVPDEAKPLISALVHWPRKFRGVTFRNEPLYPEIAALRPGDIFIIRTFWSTSKNVHYGHVRWTIRARSGADIEAVSDYKSEREVLFRPGIKFRITAVVASGSKLKIEAEEL